MGNNINKVTSGQKPFNSNNVHARRNQVQQIFNKYPQPQHLCKPESHINFGNGNKETVISEILNKIKHVSILILETRSVLLLLVFLG